jgi:hypothetical protein
VELRTPNYLLIGLKKVTQKLGMDDKFDATTVAIYFREENVKKGSVFCRYGTRKNRLSSTTHILEALRWEKILPKEFDKNNKIFRYKNLYIIDSSMISANLGVNLSLSITAIAERWIKFLLKNT